MYGFKDMVDGLNAATAGRLEERARLERMGQLVEAQLAKAWRDRAQQSSTPPTHAGEPGSDRDV